MLKIERIFGRHTIQIRLSGEFRAEHLDQVKAEVDRSGEGRLWIWRRCTS